MLHVFRLEMHKLRGHQYCKPPWLQLPSRHPRTAEYLFQGSSINAMAGLLLRTRSQASKAKYSCMLYNRSKPSVQMQKIPVSRPTTSFT